MEKILFKSSLLSLLLACQISPSHLTQDKKSLENYQAYIPAQIAVFPCMPKTAVQEEAYPFLKKRRNLDLIKGESLLCEKFDRYVVESFSSQPYINGFTPELTSKLLSEKKSSSTWHKRFQKIWFHSGLKDFSLKPAKAWVGHYEKYVQLLPEWKLWLQEVSEKTGFSDAVLFPLTTRSEQHTFTERGLYGAKRGVELLILLIEVDTAKIVWQQHRYVSKVSYGQERQGQAASLYPEWNLLYARLFTKVLWHTFPGRLQI